MPHSNSLTRLLLLSLVWSLATGCASVMTTNPKVMEAGDVRASAEVNAIAVGAPVKTGAQVGVGVYRGLELDLGAGVIPFKQLNPGEETSSLVGSFFSGGAAMGFLMESSPRPLHVKVGFDLHRETAKYSTTDVDVGSGSWLPSVSANKVWLDRTTWRYRLAGTFAVENRWRGMLYGGGGVMFSTHDIAQFSRAPEDFEGETINGLMRQDRLEMYPSLHAIGGLYIPIGPGPFAVQLEASANIPFPRSLEDEDGQPEERFFSPIRDIAQISLGFVLDLGARDDAE